MAQDAQKLGIYRGVEDGSCEVCMMQKENWKDKVIEETEVYNSRFKLALAGRLDCKNYPNLGDEFFLLTYRPSYGGLLSKT